LGLEVSEIAGIPIDPGVHWTLTCSLPSWPDEWARGKAFVSNPGEPFVRLVVLDVRRIDKGNEDVDVQ
jgi:hypothetical protein